MRVLVLGGQGMLGRTVRKHLASAGISVEATGRQSDGMEHYLEVKPGISDRLRQVFREVGPEWVINCIGVIKPRIDERDHRSVSRAIYVNALFPHELSAVADEYGARVLQIATDCVFSGRLGGYKEDSPHDPTDVYGKTKSLGELSSPHFLNLRCSIVGPESNASRSLFEWVRRQPAGARLNGFTNHRWNGLTTRAFAQVVLGVLQSSEQVGGIQHLVPEDAVNKYELLSLLADAAGRSDIEISPGEAASAVDRTLLTRFPAENGALWSRAGFPAPPSVATMVEAILA